MRRTGVEFHTEGYYGLGRAAVNVKLHHWRELSVEELEAVAADQGHPPGTCREFAAWYVRLPEDKRQGWVDLATEQGWELLESAAVEIYGEGSRVFSSGRSGGYAHVKAPGVGFYSEDVAEWEPEDFAKWGEFETACRETCADLPHSAAWLALVNAFEPENDAREEERKFSFFYDAPEGFGLESAQ